LLNENRLMRLAPGVSVRNPTANFVQQEVGYPLYGYWDWVFESYADANGNGVIDDNEVVWSGPNTTFLGGLFPTREATISPYVKLMGGRLHLTGMMQYRAGAVAPGNASVVLGCHSYYATCRARNDPSTPLAEQARAHASDLFQLGPYVERNDYLQFRELSLAIMLPTAMTRFAAAERAQLVLAGRNIAMLWKASDIPIETGEFYTDDRGSSLLTTTQGAPTYWIARLNITF
jgi:hypothetical protein